MNSVRGLLLGPNDLTQNEIVRVGILKKIFVSFKAGKVILLQKNAGNTRVLALEFALGNLLAFHREHGRHSAVRESFALNISARCIQ